MFHLVKDMEALGEAIRRGAPFGYTVCGRVETRKNFVSKREHATCPECLSLSMEEKCSEAKEQASPVVEEGSSMEEDIESDFDDMDNDTGSVIIDEHGEKVTEEREVEDQEESVETPLDVSTILMALDMFVPGDYISHDATSDAGLLGGLNDSERMFITTIVSAARAVGAGKAASYLVDIVGKNSVR